MSDDLEALIASDFIIKYVPFGMGARDECYKLVDPFCMFYPLSARRPPPLRWGMNCVQVR